MPKTQTFTNTCTCYTPRVINDTLSRDVRVQYACMLPVWFYFVLDSTPACWTLIQGLRTFFT